MEALLTEGGEAANDECCGLAAKEKATFYSLGGSVLKFYILIFYYFSTCLIVIQIKRGMNLNVHHSSDSSAHGTTLYCSCSCGLTMQSGSSF